MNPEALDCWEDYPMEHGCICGNDCPPPPLPLDPHPYMYADGVHVSAPWVRKRPPWGMARFAPRPGYSQNQEDYR